RRPRLAQPRDGGAQLLAHAGREAAPDVMESRLGASRRHVSSRRPPGKRASRHRGGWSPSLGVGRGVPRVACCHGSPRRYSPPSRVRCQGTYAPWNARNAYAKSATALSSSTVVSTRRQRISAAAAIASRNALNAYRTNDSKLADPSASTKTASAYAP